MKLSTFFLFLCTVAYAQPDFTAYKLPLRDSVRLAKNEFSGLAVAGDRLLLLCQNEEAPGPWSGLYSVALADLQKQQNDTTFAPKYRKQQLRNLPAVIVRINEMCSGCYDGLEAVSVFGDRVVMGVETKDHSSDGFLITGTLIDAEVVLDVKNIVRLAKPVLPNGSRVCNAGFESIVPWEDGVLVFFEFNYFQKGTSYYYVDLKSGKVKTEKLNALPFRLTDATMNPEGKIIGINYFHPPQEGQCEVVYRPRADDQESTSMVKNGGRFESFVRLIEFDQDKKQWKTFWTVPSPYKYVNWEGIAAHGNGFYLINDEYSEDGKKYSQLLYLQEKR